MYLRHDSRAHVVPAMKQPGASNLRRVAGGAVAMGERGRNEAADGDLPDAL